MKIAYLSDFQGEELHPETTHVFGITQEALDDCAVLEYLMDLPHLKGIHFSPSVTKLNLGYVGNIAPLIHCPDSLRELEIEGLELKKLEYLERDPDGEVGGHTFKGALPYLPQL